MKCIICDRKPPLRGRAICHNCQAKIEAEKRARRKPKPEKYLVYRGNIVGLFPNGDGKLRPELLGGNPARLPKSKTINLDKFCPGYTREQVRKMKRTVLRLAGV